MIEHILGVPTEQILALPSVRLLGDRKAEVYNYKGLISVCDQCIRIGTRAGTLVIDGCHLEIGAIDQEFLTVRGTIKRICYEDRV